ncbi:MAG: hypothetical protein Q7J47_00055 [Azoarcus sp.]|nr:hypothetical protein [Azoarcus sp.]
MRRSLITGSLALCLATLPAFAQQAPVAVVAESNTPGQVSMMEAVQASAKVTAIDKANRTITLKGPEGRVFNVVAGDQVRNFTQIAVGDEVVVEYIRALSLQVRKGGGLRERTESSGAARAMPGDKPAGIVGREVKTVADVIAVDPKKSTITLKGPDGNILELDVRNPDHFKVVKVGDQVEADYIESLAIAVEPVAMKAKDK